MALTDKNAFRVTMRKSDDRPLIESIKKLIKKSEGQEMTDAGICRRAMIEMKKRMEKEASRA